MNVILLIILFISVLLLIYIFIKKKETFDDSMFLQTTWENCLKSSSKPGKLDSTKWYEGLKKFNEEYTGIFPIEQSNDLMYIGNCISQLTNIVDENTNKYPFDTPKQGALTNNQYSTIWPSISKESTLKDENLYTISKFNQHYTPSAESLENCSKYNIIDSTNDENNLKSENCPIEENQHCKVENNKCKNKYEFNILGSPALATESDCKKLIKKYWEGIYLLNDKVVQFKENQKCSVSQ